MKFSEQFREALQDYIFLLEKKYPEKAILEMVATRHALNHFERSMLYRGVMRRETALKRKEKLITIEQLNNRTLHVDLYNVLFTIAAYLRGYPVYIAADGLLRDASESHGSGDWDVHLEKGLNLMVAGMNQLNIQKSVFYIDEPLENSTGIFKQMQTLTPVCPFDSEIISDLSPDHLFRLVNMGILATTDSTIVDRSTLPVIDLARFVLEFHYKPLFLRLEDYLDFI